VLEPSKNISDITITCECGGAHHLYVGVQSSLAHCDDCGEILPVTAASIACDDYTAQVLAMGIIVSWPTFSVNGEEVACA